MQCITFIEWKDNRGYMKKKGEDVGKGEWEPEEVILVLPQIPFGQLLDFFIMSESIRYWFDQESNILLFTKFSYCQWYYEVALVLHIVCWLTRYEATVQTLGHILRTKRNMKKYFCAGFFSVNFWHNLRVNKIGIKSFAKYMSYGVDCKLQFPPLVHKINVRTEWL